MQKLNEHISVLSDFQFSINLEYDLFSDQKIRNYIPTTSAIDIIEDVLLSTSPKSTDRARIFVGAYGKGKSHLALMLLSLLSRKDKSLYGDLLNVICQSKPELCKYILEYQDSNKRLLPVVIQGSSMGIRQALLVGIRRALQVAGIDDVMPNTYFNAAICSINNWKESYPETYERFKDKVSCPISEFLSELGNFNNKYYEQFINIYPSLTSGSEFNPVNGMDIVELYNDVNGKIKKHGYTGIFVVYDEFSKFLSGNLKNINSDEIEILQYFAENCNRSGSKQIHIMLISHQSILNYMDKLPKSKVNSWKAVSQRFKTVELNTSAAQMYDLTSHVIKKDANWFDVFRKDSNNKASFEKMKAQWVEQRLFSELTSEELDKVIYGCYPLDPVTTFLLPQISEKIAQNERTLFTFLSADGQKYTLSYYLKTTNCEGVPFLTPDYIFDYFEGLFKADGYDRATHKYWKIATSAIAKLDSTQALEKRIIKTLALVYILDRFELLSPTVSTLMSIYSSDKITAALTRLTDDGIIRKLDGKDYLKITEYTGKNVDVMITDKVNERSLSIKVEGILNHFSGNRVLYPNAYNDDHEIVRYFDFEFISADKILVGYDFIAELDNVDGDGIVYAVVSNAEQYDEVVRCISSVSEKRIVFVVLKEGSDVLASVYRYDAITQLISEAKRNGDDVLVEELSSSLSALDELLNSYVDLFLRPELACAQYFFGGIEKTIKRRSALSKAISVICEEVFALCPTINNEVINKNVISSQAVNARNKLIAGILSNELKPQLGLNGSGQEISFMRSTLFSTGIIKEGEDGIALSLNANDELLSAVLSYIKEFIVRTSVVGKRCLGELFDYLSNPKNRIGLKKGVIPVYFAVVLHYYKKYCVILKGAREIEIDAKLLDLISNDPYSYDLYLENWDPDKDAYIQGLETIFKEYVLTVEKEYNNFEYIVKAMQRWYFDLPKYVKEIRNIYIGEGNVEQCDSRVVRFLNALRNPEINAREFLFNKLVWVFDETAFSSKISGYVAQTKNLVEKIKSDLLDKLGGDLIRIFSKGKYNEKSSLSSVVLDWLSLLRKEVFAHMFNGNENSLLAICSAVTPDQSKFIEILGRNATGLRIDDWAEITIEGFLNTIRSFVSTIEAYNSDVATSTTLANKSYKISFIDENGIESYRTFDGAQYTPAAKLMYNDAAAMIEEYGEALSQNEKRQVLIDIINKLLG